MVFRISMGRIMAKKETSREKTLTLLEKNRGTYISGEEIAEQLQISRNSVWKAVRALRKEGYKIAAATNKGYCLTVENDILSVQGIRSYLRMPASGVSAEPEIFVYEEIASTNLTAKEFALQGAAHGTVVIAERQTAGAGRASGSFFSPEGGLYMSIIIRPDARGIKPYTEEAASSVAQAINEVCGVMPVVQNTGDLILNGKKICGILTESGGEIETGMVHYLVIGIGIHFNTPAAAFPQKLRGTCGSIFPELSAAAGTKPADATRNRLAAEIINRMLL